MSNSCLSDCIQAVNPNASKVEKVFMAEIFLNFLGRDNLAKDREFIFQQDEAARLG